MQCTGTCKLFAIQSKQMLTEGPGKVTENLCNPLEFSRLLINYFLVTFQSNMVEFHQVILNTCIDSKLFEILFIDIFLFNEPCSYCLKSFFIVLFFAMLST